MYMSATCMLNFTKLRRMYSILCLWILDSSSGHDWIRNTGAGRSGGADWLGDLLQHLDRFAKRFTSQQQLRRLAATSLLFQCFSSSSLSSFCSSFSPSFSSAATRTRKSRQTPTATLLSSTAHQCLFLTVRRRMKVIAHGKQSLYDARPDAHIPYDHFIGNDVSPMGSSGLWFITHISVINQHSEHWIHRDFSCSDRQTQAWTSATHLHSIANSLAPAKRLVTRGFNLWRVIPL